LDAPNIVMAPAKIHFFQEVYFM